MRTDTHIVVVAYLNDYLVKGLFLFAFLDVFKVVIYLSVGSFLPVIVPLKSIIKECMIGIFKGNIFEFHIVFCPFSVNIFSDKFTIIVIQNALTEFNTDA